MLMNGAVLRKRPNRKKESSQKGSLYSKLIMRNMADDKPRVAVTIVIIAFSCMLIGMGMSMKLAFSGMIEKQTTEVAKYDMIMNVGRKVTDEDKEKLNAVLDSENVSYLQANISSLMYRWDGDVNAMRVVCADPARLGDYYSVTDPKTGQDIEIPNDGMLIQHRMHESFDMNAGDKLTVMDASLVALIEQKACGADRVQLDMISYGWVSNTFAHYLREEIGKEGARYTARFETPYPETFLLKPVFSFLFAGTYPLYIHVK
jgi:hypothetical protein